MNTNSMSEIAHFGFIFHPVGVSRVKSLKIDILFIYWIPLAGNYFPDFVFKDND